MEVQGHRIDNFDSCENPGDFFFTLEQNGTRRMSFL